MAIKHHCHNKSEKSMKNWSALPKHNTPRRDVAVFIF